MAVADVFRGKRFSRFVLVVLIWGAAVWFYEFRLNQRPTLTLAIAPVATVQAAPPLNLHDVSFACAGARSFVTSVQVSGSSVLSKCESGFNEATTRCPAGLPMAGFGDGIKCPPSEAVHCHGGPVQALGLFKDDSFCGDITDHDMGPPLEAPRADD